MLALRHLFRFFRLKMTHLFFFSTWIPFPRPRSDFDTTYVSPPTPSFPNLFFFGLLVMYEAHFEVFRASLSSRASYFEFFFVYLKGSRSTRSFDIPLVTDCQPSPPPCFRGFFVWLEPPACCFLISFPERSPVMLCSPSMQLFPRCWVS